MLFFYKNKSVTYLVFLSIFMLIPQLALAQGASGPTSSSRTTATTSSSALGASGPTSSSRTTVTTSSSALGASGPTSSSRTTVTTSSSSTSGASGPTSSSWTSSSTSSSNSTTSTSTYGASGPTSSSWTSSTTAGPVVVPVDPREAAPASSLISLVTGLKNATIAAVKAVTATANSLVNTAGAIIKPHYDAYQSGILAEQRELARILSCTSNCASTIDNQSLLRANDIGVYNSYAAQGIDPKKQIVPTGPMQRLTFGLTSGLAPEELENIKTVDQLFRDGFVQVYEPGDITSVNGRKLLGPVYDLLSPQQKIGLENSIFVQGEVDMQKFGYDATIAPRIPGFNDALSFGGAALGGLLVIDTVNPPAGVIMDELLMHELQHAADIAIKNIAVIRMQDTTLTLNQRNIARAAYSSAGAAVYDRFNELAVNSNYVNSFKELRGFSVSPSQIEELAKNIANGVVDPRLPPPSVPFVKMTIEEGRILANELLQSPTLNQINSDFDALIYDIQN